MLEALARDTTPAEAERPEQPPDPEKLADALTMLVMRLRARGIPIQEVVLAATADRPEPETTRPLADILPPASWLTPAQRRLWRERTATYAAEGWPRPAAEQEAMAELVTTGRLVESSTRYFTFD